ncbi:MAG: hypothetical protein JO076_17300 [Verrucomicrobia bacterium]|nr:hypothetical protein [Verrucomicrobiota bacterium]
MPADPDARGAIAENLSLAVIALEKEAKNQGEIVSLIAELLASIQLAFLFGRAKWIQAIVVAGKLAYSVGSGKGQWQQQVVAIRPFLAQSEKIAAENLTGLHYQILEHTRAMLSDETAIHIAEIARCGCLLAYADRQVAPRETKSSPGT